MYFICLKDTILLHLPTTDNVQIRLIVEYNFLPTPTACIPTDAIADASITFHPELGIQFTENTETLALLPVQLLCDEVNVFDGLPSVVMACGRFKTMASHEAFYIRVSLGPLDFSMHSCGRVVLINGKCSSMCRCTCMLSPWWVVRVEHMIDNY